MYRRRKWKAGVSVVLAASLICSMGIQAFASEEWSTKWNSSANVVREDVHSVGLSDETKAYALDVTKRLADEGMVLMKNDHETLPLAEHTKVALFGSTNWTTTRSDSNTGFIRFKDAAEQSEKLEIDSSLMGTIGALDEAALAEVRADTDAAVIVLQRSTSEGNESANYDLSSNEDQLIRQIGQTYDRVIVVLNTVCQIASDWMLDDEYGVDAVLWAGQPGNLGGQTVVDILTGDVNPSGRLVDTWAAGDWSVYPSSAHWGVDETVDGIPTVYYTDDIYVGYRYFETFDKPVNFAFGSGLSYTDFVWSDYDLTPNWTEATLTASVNVTNVGSVAGKDVVELYFSYPDTQGLISLDVPSIQLLQYAKTDLLQPEETQRISITFDMSDLSLYNEANTCFQMYAGDYQIKFGRSVEEIEEQIDFSYSSTTSVLGGTLGHKMTPQTEIEVLADTDMDGELTINSKPVTRYYDENADSTNASILGTGEPLTEEEINGTGYGYSLTQVENGEITMDEFMEDLSLLELLSMTSGISNGAPFLNPYYDANGDGEYTFDENMAELNRSINLSYTGTSNGILARDVYNISMSDRQESVSVTGAYLLDEDGNVIRSSNNAFGFQVYPSSVVIASTWNQELIEEYGEAIGREMQEAGMDTWFSPSMNIHRNPCGGRNSEYYSEDPVITGYSAAASCKGVEKLGGNVTLKHFAGNNQEEERRQINEIISERALREIYLKGYEIAVKETADKDLYPGYTGVMTSYNRINGAWSSENYDMIYKIATQEWGFCGWAVTDYQMECSLELALAAGTCIWAPTIPGVSGNASAEDQAMFTNLYESIKDGYIPLEQIRSNVEKTMYVALHVLDTMDGCTVCFVGMDGEEISATKVIPDGSGKVTIPEAPAVDGYVFTGWDVDVENCDFRALTDDLTVTAQYRAVEPGGEEPGTEEPSTEEPEPGDNSEILAAVTEAAQKAAEAAQSAAEAAQAAQKAAEASQAAAENQAAMNAIVQAAEEAAQAAADAQAAAEEAAEAAKNAAADEDLIASAQAAQELAQAAQATAEAAQQTAEALLGQITAMQEAQRAADEAIEALQKAQAASDEEIAAVRKEAADAQTQAIAAQAAAEKAQAEAEAAKQAYRDAKDILETVVKQPGKTRISLAKKSYTVKVGKKKRISLQVTNTNGRKVTYQSSNKKVAKVTKKGVIKGVKKGTAKITIRCNGAKRTVKVTVK